MLDATTAMHWYSDGRVFERPWDEVFVLGVTAARALGSRPEEARLLNFLGWARHICLGDNEAGLVTHRQALLVAVEARRGRTPTSVRYCCASAVPRKRSNTPRKSRALCSGLGFWTTQVSMRDRLGRVLQGLGRYDEALGVHRAILADVHAHAEETHAVTQRYMTALVTEEVGNCLAGLEQWREAAWAYGRARSKLAVNGLHYLEARCALHEGKAWRLAGEHSRARACFEVALKSFAGPATRAQWEETLAELRRLPEND